MRYFWQLSQNDVDAGCLVFAVPDAGRQPAKTSP
jgi:hypothetical protein